MTRKIWRYKNIIHHILRLSNVFTPFMTKIYVMGFAENVKFEMDFQDIQMKELSIKTGISKNTLDKYLFGKKVQPGVENAVKIAIALGVSVEYLVFGDFKSGEKSTFVNSDYSVYIDKYKRLNKFNRKTIDDLIESLLTRQ